jgi:hypothetical protein
MKLQSNNMILYVFENGKCFSKWWP